MVERKLALGVPSWHKDNPNVHMKDGLMIVTELYRQRVCLVLPQGEDWSRRLPEFREYLTPAR